MRRNSDNISRSRASVKNSDKENLKRASEEAEQVNKFQTSILYMNIVKKCEKMMFREREEEMAHNLSLLEKQNQLMKRLTLVPQSQYLLEERERSISSITVLEQLDLNRKQAFGRLKQENEILSNRIQELQLTLDSMEKLERSASLCPEYLARLENKIRKREKVRKMLTDKLEASQDKVNTKVKAIQAEWGDRIPHLPQALRILTQGL